jgi:hypothetical protein
VLNQIFIINTMAVVAAVIVVVSDFVAASFVFSDIAAVVVAFEIVLAIDVIAAAAVIHGLLDGCADGGQGTLAGLLTQSEAQEELCEDDSQISVVAYCKKIRSEYKAVL